MTTAGKVQLVDAEWMHRRSPSTFGIPPAAERRALQSGDMVKLGFRGNEGDAERMWVRITKVTAGPRYKGKLDNKPLLLELQLGDSVSFEPRHVHQIERAS